MSLVGLGAGHINACRTSLKRTMSSRTSSWAWYRRGTWSYAAGVLRPCVHGRSRTPRSNDPWLPSLGRLVMSLAVTRELMAPTVCRASGRDLTPFSFVVLVPSVVFFFTVSRRPQHGSTHVAGARMKIENRRSEGRDLSL